MIHQIHEIQSPMKFKDELSFNSQITVIALPFLVGKEEQ